MKRSPMPRRSAGLRPGKALRRGTSPGRRKRGRSSGRARPNEPLAVWCEAHIEGVCTGRAHHRHHLLRRSQGGDDSRENTTDLCHACHAWAHDHPAEAYARGLLRRRSA